MNSLWWQQLLVVAAGGALGSAGRFITAGWLTRQLGDGFPWGTLAVNLLGSLAAGVALMWLGGREGTGTLLRAFLVIGILGGFTTWSALMLDVMLLNRVDGPHWAAAYVVVSFAGGLLLLWAGVRLGAAFRFA